MSTMLDAFELYVNMASVNGIEIGVFELVMTFVASFFALIARILKITACVSLGQLAPNHKVLSSFGFYYGIYFVQRILTMFYYIVVFGFMARTGDPGWFFGSSWEFTLISSLLYSVIFYFLTWYVMEKKLNLD